MRRFQLWITGISCVISAITILSMMGCTYSSVVTTDPQYRGDYEQGGIYILLDDVYLADRKVGGWAAASLLKYELNPYECSKQKKCLTGTRDGKLSANPLDWEHVIGVVRKGTRLRFVRLLYFFYTEDETTVPIAEIIDGPFEGNEVSLEVVSRHVCLPWEELCRKNNNSLRYFWDPRWLKQVD